MIEISRRLWYQMPVALYRSSIMMQHLSVYRSSQMCGQQRNFSLIRSLSFVFWYEIVTIHVQSNFLLFFYDFSHEKISESFSNYTIRCRTRKASKDFCDIASYGLHHTSSHLSPEYSKRWYLYKTNTIRRTSSVLQETRRRSRCLSRDFSAI